MSQVLNVGEGKFLTFDRSWADNGDDAQYAMIGGSKVLIKPAGRARPQIFQRGDGFYYKDGSPVTNVEHVSYLPEKFRKMAEKFVTGGEAPALEPVKTREAAVEQAVKRGRGRPKKAEPRKSLEIKDDASLRELAGPDA